MARADRCCMFWLVLEFLVMSRAVTAVARPVNYLGLLVFFSAWTGTIMFCLQLLQTRV